MYENKLKKRLKNGETCLGCFISLGHPAITEIAAVSGLDFMVIDTEHGDSDFQSVINHIRAAEVHGATPIVRVTSHDVKQIGRYLDNGAYGIQIPMVGSGEEAKRVADATRFAPMGNRGVSGGRGSIFWGARTIPEGKAFCNEEVMCVCMVETRSGLEQVEEIAKTPNIDVIFIGTADLCGDMGVDMGSPEMESAVARILAACQANGVVPGIVTGDPTDSKKRIAQGFKYVTILNTQALMRKTIAGLVKEVRG